MDANEHINNFNSFLRVSKIDELPQIINILLGQLSLVGPRPLQFEYQKLYNEEQLKRFNVMPGITGWSQINSKENTTTWKKKFELDIWYVENCSFLLDLKIIFLTLKILSLSFQKNKKSYESKNLMVQLNLNKFFNIIFYNFYLNFYKIFWFIGINIKRNTSFT